MPDKHNSLCYHGRRSVDEIIGALNADHATVALAHKELSRLHLERFISLMSATANGIHNEPETVAWTVAPVYPAELVGIYCNPIGANPDPATTGTPIEAPSETPTRRARAWLMRHRDAKRRLKSKS